MEIAHTRKTVGLLGNWIVKTYNKIAINIVLFSWNGCFSIRWGYCITIQYSFCTVVVWVVTPCCLVCTWVTDIGSHVSKHRRKRHKFSEMYSTGMGQYVRPNADQVKADSHIACRDHAVPMPFPCHAVPRPCPAPTVPCPSWKSAW
jgi:hypothetical protein